MNSSAHKALAAASVAVFLALTGCSAAQSSSGRLQAGAVRSTLRELPFAHQLWTITPPSGDDAAFRGVAKGSKPRTILHFSISLGVNPTAIPIPKTKLQDPTGEGEAGFIFNDDAADAKKFKTVPQWHAAIHIATEIEEALCRRANGKPCPV